MEDKKDTKFLRGLLSGIALGLIVAIVTCAGTNLWNLSDYIINKKNENASSYNSKYVSESTLKKIDGIADIIDKRFLYDFDKNKMSDAMYAAVLNSLGDPYSVYYTADQYKSLQQSSEGKYCGIGVVVQQNPDTGIVTAVNPYTDSPGYKAGIRKGDIIYKVDGTDITGMDLSAAVLLIKGDEGTKVKITLVRDNKTIDVEVTREEISVQTVSHEMLDNNIGYIKIDEFDAVTVDQFADAMSDLKDKGMKGLVIDLRDNPGGLLNSVKEMLDTILPEGLIVYTEDKDGNRQEYKSDADTILDVPMSVLVNGNSASASEIFAGAVKDYGVGTLVGTTTFGKGIVQSIIPFIDGSAMKITVEDYYTPKGNNIHKKGIKPDVEIELNDDVKSLSTVPHDKDNQLQKALEILNGKIK